MRQKLLISTWKVVPPDKNEQSMFQERVLIFSNPADQKSHVEAFTYLYVTKLIDRWNG